MISHWNIDWIRVCPFRQDMGRHALNCNPRGLVGAGDIDVRDQGFQGLGPEAGSMAGARIGSCGAFMHDDHMVIVR
jgi:hypothetical protein